MLKHNGGFLLFSLLEAYTPAFEERRSDTRSADRKGENKGTQQPKARNTTKRSNLLQNVVINKNKLLNTIQNC